MIVTRFAPSPTGHLHIGGLRTALFNWLYAKKHSGKFILRVEDTDLERSKSQYTNAIFQALKWCGLDWDEVYYQSKRNQIYQSFVNKLINEGKAYKCYCTKERLEELKKTQMEKGENPHYDEHCKNIKEDLNKPYVVRIVLPHEYVNFEDKVHGVLKFSYKEFDDFIVQRSDCTFMYNFTNVIDDITMGVTHVIRGDDHITNTAKQLYLYKLLDANQPKFAHIPMILGKDHTRLSKRHGAQSVLDYKEMGFLPQALVNYLARLGWAYGDKEIFTKDELLELFDLEGLNKSPAIFDMEKLRWLNSYYIKNIPACILYDELVNFFSDNCKMLSKEYLCKAIDVMKPRVSDLLELAVVIEFFCSKPLEYEEKGVKKYITQKTKDILVSFLAQFEKLSLDDESFKLLINKIADGFDEKVINVAQPIRIALTGKSAGPGLFEMIEILGKKETIERIDLFIDKFTKKQ